jgi:hypothetical protein
MSILTEVKVIAEVVYTSDSGCSATSEDPGSEPTVEIDCVHLLFPQDDGNVKRIDITKRVTNIDEIEEEILEED